MPDPTPKAPRVPPPPTAAAGGPMTHKPNPNGGTVCGLFPPPTSAAMYNDADPSCPKCKDWYDKAKAHTAAKLAAMAPAEDAAPTK